MKNTEKLCKRCGTKHKDSKGRCFYCHIFGLKRNKRKGDDKLKGKKVSKKKKVMKKRKGGKKRCT